MSTLDPAGNSNRETPVGPSRSEQAVIIGKAILKHIVFVFLLLFLFITLSFSTNTAGWIGGCARCLTVLAVAGEIFTCMRIYRLNKRLYAIQQELWEENMDLLRKLLKSHGGRPDTLGIGELIEQNKGGP